MHGDTQVGDCLVRIRLNTVSGPLGEVRLEPKAMEVLSLLLQRPGEVVSRQEILERVWSGRFVSDEVLTNVISQIRRALGDSPKDPRFIQTIAKSGYRLIAPVRSSTPPKVPTAEGNRSSWRWWWWATTALALSVAGPWLLFVLVAGENDPTRRLEQRGEGSVSVHEFESLSRDADLDWLRTGIAELMVTGLSQTSRLRIMGPSQRLNLGAATPESELVISGSFARVGERLRIDSYATESETGEILFAEAVEGASLEDLFEVVDGLAARMAIRLELVHDGEPHLSRALRSVVTERIDAYQHYVEGTRGYYFNLDHLAALNRYEKAIELDPNFAMAHAKLAIVHMNLGNFSDANASARRALSHLDRLPKSERHYVAGNFYVTREETYADALTAYRRALEVDPRHLAARHNTGFIYFRLERYREAIEVLRPLVESGVRYPGSHRLLMMSYAALGEFDAGARVARKYVAQHPEKWLGYRFLGQHLIRAGQLAEARQALFRADALRPGDTGDIEWWQLNLLSERRNAPSKPPRQPEGAPHLGPSMRLLYDGDALSGLVALDLVEARPETSRRWSPVLLNLASATRLQVGDIDIALRNARRARELGVGNATEWEGLALEARALASKGEWKRAQRLVKELERRTEQIPSSKEKRRIAYLRGELALLRGDPGKALHWLAIAENFLPPRGFPITVQLPQHVPIRYARAEAFRAKGDSKQAKHWYRRITQSTTERLVWPIPFVRSFYHLGVLHEADGELGEATRCYRQFLAYWGDGELDRDRVAAARAALDAMPSFIPDRAMAGQRSSGEARVARARAPGR